MAGRFPALTAPPGGRPQAGDAAGTGDGQSGAVPGSAALHLGGPLRSARVQGHIPLHPARGEDGGSSLSGREDQGAGPPSGG